MQRRVNKAVSVILMLSLLLALAACNTTEYSDDSSNVIEAETLAELVNDSSVVVIDARSEEEYAKGHMEGAINLPPSKLTVSEPVSGLIAPKETVEEVLGANGITADSKIVVYGNKGGVYSGRVWWVLKVYGHDWVKVVNDGEDAIVAAGLNLSADTPEVTPVTYTAKEQNASMIATLEDVQAVAEGTASGCIIDVRSQAEYDEGAIPTAVLYPHTKNLYTDGTFKSARDIYLDYNDLGISKKEPVILYCKSSYRATQTLLLMEEAGYENVKVYDGAWFEWSTKDMPKAEPVEQTAPSTQDAS